MDDTASVVECRLDWLTVTCSDPDKRKHFLNFGLELVKVAATDDLPVQRWKWRGYDGQHANGATCGRREDSDILQLSGPMADEWFDIAWTHADHCTRIDLAVTVKTEEPIGRIIAACDGAARSFKGERGTGPNCTLIYSEGDAATFYLGQRTSDLFLRVYNKRLESGEPDYDGCLRYEMEVKGAPAQRTASWLHSAGNRPDSIQHAVYEHCVRRGLSPRFRSVGGTVHIGAVRPRSDAATRLAWLASGVRPVIQKLLPLTGPERLLEALGFPRTVTEYVRLCNLVDNGNHFDPLKQEELGFGNDTDRS